jgi:hypothetical protein
MTEQEKNLSFRGKCKEMSEELIEKDPTLRLVRGYYFDALWGRQEHWWCEDGSSNIIDPTKDQFPTKGNGAYVEFDGIIECSQCGKTMKEEQAMFHGNYAFCCTGCACRFVGI